MELRVADKFLAHPDGSLIGLDGRVLYCSLERFERDIVRGRCCFICCASPDRGVAFDDEHVMPQWLLRKFDLYHARIALPHRRDQTYKNYTLPCCSNCNKAMGRTFEDPIRRLFEAGQESVGREMMANGPWRIFCWLALLFLKTHLKDRQLALRLDRREGDLRLLGDLISYVPLHHVHAVARAFHTGATLTPEACGSIFVLPADRNDRAFQPFDYSDLYDSRSLLVRIDDTAIVAVLDDSCAAWNIYKDEFKGLTAPLSPVQLREVFANVSCISANLKARPRFFTDLGPDGCSIVGLHPPKPELNSPLNPTLGSLMAHTLRDHVDHLPDAVHILKLIREEKYTFLFGPDGKQIVSLGFLTK